MWYMVKMENKLKILIIGVMIAAIILGGVYSFIPAYVVSDPSIVYTVAVGANLSGIESVEVNGTVCNDGDKEIKNRTLEEKNKH